jgi:predicted secreted protein
MGWVTGIAVYVVIWWTVLFAVLPWGVRPNGEAGKGFEPGAPANPRLLMKALATSAISAVLWLALYAVVESGLISLRDIG